jgi:hypothetical protein
VSDTDCEQLYTGLKAPHYIEFTVTRCDGDASPPDFTTCTEARLLFRFNNRTDSDEWALEIVSKTETELVVRHVFDEDGTDLPRAGTAHFQVLYTLDPDGERQTAPVDRVIYQAP